jgi:uncharacterized protein
MSDRLPDRLFPGKFVRGSLEGRWGPDRCPRVEEFAEIRTDIALALDFTTQASGQVLIAGSLKVALGLVCQRCLQPFIWSLDAPLKLAVCRNDRDYPGIADGYEPLEVDEDGGIEMQRLIEDEIIVRIPDIPIHAEVTECDPEMLQRSREFDEPAGNQVSDGRENPFAVLKKGVSKN